MDDSRLARNTRVVAEALARFVYELPAAAAGASPAAVLSDEMVRGIREGRVRRGTDWGTGAVMLRFDLHLLEGSCLALPSGCITT